MARRSDVERGGTKIEGNEKEEVLPFAHPTIERGRESENAPVTLVLAYGGCLLGQRNVCIAFTPIVFTMHIRLSPFLKASKNNKALRVVSNTGTIFRPSPVRQGETTGWVYPYCRFL